MMRRRDVLVVTLLMIWAGLAAAQNNPLLEVSEPGLGSWQFSAPVSVALEYDIADGALIRFSWTADAGSYGGTVAGYRYGWDLMDPDDPNDPGWATADLVPDLSATPRSYNSGLHTFHVRATDTDGGRTLAAFYLRVVPQVPLAKIPWGTLKALYGE
jgi:hypothetical protein